MASIDTGGGDSGHKKGPRRKESQKTFYPCGYDADGGSGFFADHFFHFYYYHEHSYYYGSEYA